MPTSLSAHAQEILRHTLGERSRFRDGQWEAIEAIVQHRQRLIVVQKTGWGKSLVYFMATRLHRDMGRGMTLLISPLLSLMRNQTDAAHRFDLRVARIDSTNDDQHQAIQAQVLHNEIDLLFISPERLGNQQFRQQVWSQLRHNVSLVVIDEVHCISDWGHDFRPDYRRVLQILSEIPSGTPVLGTTATANSRVIADVQAVLGGDVHVSRGALTRESLQLYVYPEIQSAASRLVLLSHLLKNIHGTGIIYCTTTRDCQIVANWLQQDGFNVEPYYADVESETHIKREVLEQKLLHNEVKALAASVALGMGFDKPDLAFVIHYQMPGSIISYYQQIGRAGRGIANAHIVLMRGEEDRDIQEHFINAAFPGTRDVQNVISLIRDHPGVMKGTLRNEVNLSDRQLEKILQHLEIDGIVRLENGRCALMSDRLPDFKRWDRVKQQRFDELEQMEAYAATDGCLMQFLAQALEDPSHPSACGHCKNCRQAQSRFVLDIERLQLAERFLRRGNPIWIEPRKQWYKRDPITRKAKFDTTNERGLALSYYNDAGYGKLVKDGKYVRGKFDDDLVEAAATLIHDHWHGQITWVTHVPSTRHPHLVADFSERLAQRLDLPFRSVITCTRHYPEQKTMQNTRQQLKNIKGAFSISPEWMKAPVLLVDDMIDSGWTLTEIGYELRRLGVPRVYPFVLARASAS
jgi:ATP-dependent DNA helicase RecQ